MTFRKKIACSKKVTKARLYATALGIYEMTLNGEKVGDIYFAPGFTSYKHQLQYQTYDVTEQLKSSEGMAKRADCCSWRRLGSRILYI